MKLFEQRTTNNVPNFIKSSVSVEWGYGIVCEPPFQSSGIETAFPG